MEDPAKDVAGHYRGPAGRGMAAGPGCSSITSAQGHGSEPRGRTPDSSDHHASQAASEATAGGAAGMASQSDTSDGSTEPSSGDEQVSSEDISSDPEEEETLAAEIKAQYVAAAATAGVVFRPAVAETASRCPRFPS
eukprot:gene5833-6074_t